MKDALSTCRAVQVRVAVMCQAVPVCVSIPGLAGDIGGHLVYGYRRRLANLCSKTGLEVLLLCLPTPRDALGY